MDKESQTILHQEKIPGHYGVIGVLVSMLFFTIINRILCHYGAPKSVNSDFFKWRNLVISWIHAFIAGSWNLSCVYRYPDMFDDLVAHSTWYSYCLVAFSTGYFFYDWVDLIIHGRQRKHWEVVCHHIAVTSIFMFNLITCQCIAYNCIALMAEVNTFFLHTRKLLQMSEISFNPPIYRANNYLNMFTFLICRFGALCWIIYGMIHWHERVSTAYFWVLTFSMACMCCINIGLFSRLMRSDFLRSGAEEPKVHKWQLHAANGVVANNNHNKETVENNHTKAE